MAKYADYDDWNVQLAYTYKDGMLNHEEPFWITEKYNGCRATFYDGNLVSRGGKIIQGVEHLNEQLKYINKYLCVDVVFDGELILKPKYRTYDSNKDFRVANGIVNRTIDMSEKHKLQYVIFDAITTTEFECETSYLPYSDRREELNAINNILTDKTHIIVTEPLYYGADQSKIYETLLWAEERGKEGVMINRDAPYVFRRTTNLLKVKKFNTIDLKVIGFTAGKEDSKYATTLGAIVCEYKGNTVNVGSGMNDAQRDYIWDNQEHLLGMTCEVKYKEVSKNKVTGLESLQFPIFVDFRWDK